MLTVEEFCKEIYTFLHNNFTPDYIESGTTPTKLQKIDSQDSVPNTPQPVDDTNNIISLTEEEQLEIAIQKSLQEANASAAQLHSDDSDDYEEPSDDESELGGSSRKVTPRKPDATGIALIKSTGNHVKKILQDDVGNSNENDNKDSIGPKTRLMLRLPNGKSEVINRSASSTIGDLVAFIKRNYKNLVTLETCRINCPAIRKDLCDLDDCQTLEEAKLHPSAVLHISSDD